MSTSIQVYGGGTFDPLDPDPEKIDIGDIAHALSMQCRFTGHVSTFYSIAQHSALAAFRCSPENSLSALLHDAAEAYLGDLVTPLKNTVYGAEYREVEERIMRAVSERFGTPHPDPAEVKEVDMRLLVTERRDMLPSTPEGDEIWAPWVDGIEPYEEEIIGMPPLGAELTFLKMFELLGGKQ